MKQTWALINELRGKSKTSIKASFKVDGKLVKDKREISNGFNMFFSSIASKLNAKLYSSRPIRDGASSENELNYRQYFNKRIVNSIFFNCCDVEEIEKTIKSFQSDKASDISILELGAWMDNSETDVIYLDYAKAFDKVDHAILLKKIKSYGIRGQLYDWIEEFLRGRTQTVVDGKHSRPAPVISGVPQGTVLGPILFLLYVNDMERFIKNCKISSFADDTRISRKISQMSDTDLLQEDLNRIIRWSEDNNMKLHEDKFELLCYRTPATRKLSEVLPFMGDITSYQTPNGTCLEGSALVKDLGVTMSEELS
ncbi:hypothetical protein ACHWQZ_G012006 [Mnemiopsis leidyi]